MSEVSKNPELSNPKQSATDQDTKHHGGGIQRAEKERQTSDPQKGGQSNATSNYQTSDPQKGGQSSTASNIFTNVRSIRTTVMAWMGSFFTTVPVGKQDNQSEFTQRNTLITRRLVVGIFSRSSAEEYDWLVKTLRSRFEVKPCYISNNGFHQFMKETSQCQCAILYHSKNRGRCNVTDVTDSLYDEELSFMSQILGKDRVWVVIDDLDDNSADVKNKFLHTQPTIQEKANDLYLIKHGAAEQKVKDLEQYEHLFNVSLTSLAVQ